MLEQIIRVLLAAGMLCILSSCSKYDCIASPKADCICTEQYDPVCGCNNVTYSNPCFANCDGITEFKKGQCD